ncbi:MAG: MucBP domain-containing protein, partial [Clostridia bacterium]|nr:MucBP domain-containing protein [Clostridia bacterium]
YTLTVYYVDDQGKEIAPPTVHFLYYNEKFKQTGTAILPVLEGYRTACEVIDLGLITEPGDRTFTVTYLPLTYTVSVVQVDRSGTRLSDKVYTFTVLHGSDATVDLSALDEIPHYELSDQNTYVIKNVKADITADKPFKIVYQKKAYALTIEFQNAEGNPIDQSQIITAYYGEPVRYEVPSRQEQGYMALDSVLTLESYNGQKSLVARYKRVIFQIELQLVEVSADGQRQLLSEKMDIVYGTHFVYQAPVIIGYTAAQAQIDLGTVTEQPQTPIVIAYTPDAYDLTIQLVDAQGNLLGTQLVTDIRVGSTYKILLDPVDGYVTDGITVEGIMSPEEVNKTVSVTLNKKPAPQPDPEPQPEPDPKPEPQPSDDGSDLTIVLVGVGCAIGMALGVTVTVLVLRKRKQKQQE